MPGPSGRGGGAAALCGWLAADTVALVADAYLAGTVKHTGEAELQHERARRVATAHRHRVTARGRRIRGLRNI
jgi:hypothetical protein